MKTVTGDYTTAYVYTDMVEDYALAQVKQLCDQEAFKELNISPELKARMTQKNLRYGNDNWEKRT